MQVQLINVAQKLPAWADAACEDYLRRIPPEIKPKIVTLPLPARKPGQSSEKQQQQEARSILKLLHSDALNLALDERGEQWSSRDWSQQLQRWMLDHPRVNLIIGGPDGLADECLQACRHRISLGRMTMPHALVKIVVLEQLYRAWSILQRHPYHRE